MRKINLLIISIIVFSCSTNKVKQMSFYIPKNYKGWVAIVYNTKNSNNLVYESENEIKYFVNNNPCFYPVKSDVAPEGFYQNHFYYYDEKDTVELRSSGSILQVTGFGLSRYTKGNTDFLYTSFYVSDTIKNSNEVHKEKDLSPKICIPNQ